MAMGLELPPVSPPAGNYVPAVRSGSLLFVSGHGPARPDGRRLEAAALEPAKDPVPVRMGFPHDVVEVVEAPGGGLLLQPVEDEGADPPALGGGIDGQEHLGVAPDGVDPAEGHATAVVV